MIKKTLSVLTLLAAGTSHAAGFAFDTHSARATSLGFATTASIDDASAVAYNAANILAVKKLDIMVGDVTTLPTLRFHPEGEETQTTDTIVVPPPHAFAVYRISDKMAAGIGLFVPFAAGAAWKSDFIDRTRGYKAEVATFFINPTFAYQLHDRFRIGAGFNLVRGTVSIERFINFVDSEGLVQLGGSGWGVGYNVGANAVLVKDLLSFGAQFRGPVAMSFKGNGDFQNIPPEFANRLKDQPISAEITLPGTLNMGFALTPLERLTLALDAQLALWSSIEEFAIRFEDSSIDDPLPKRWKNTLNFRVGAEYGVTEKLSARVGFTYDPAPTPSDTLTPDLPDANRYLFSAGAGYNFDPLRVDLAYQFAYLAETPGTALEFEGSYGGKAHGIGLSVSYSLK